uniref:ethanolamine kinase n=1 Tax=Ciona savignyi TaxID=51511 RepID=H2Y500_CIOSA
MENQVLKVDISIDIEHALEGARGILKLVRPAWKEESINHKVFDNGITNKMFGFHENGRKSDTVLVRVNGNKTEIFLDRKAEVESFELLHHHKCAPLLYCVFNNGLAYQFIKGTTLTPQTVRKDVVCRLVGQEMARMHKIPLPTDHKPEAQTFKLIRKFMGIAFDDSDGPVDTELEARLRAEVRELELLLVDLNSPLVFCHNDLLVHNIIYNEEEGNLSFIDYEYAGYNYQAADIGNHFCEFAGIDNADFSLYPDRGLQLRWLRGYLAAYRGLVEDDVSDEDVEKLYREVNKFALAAHLFWGIWSLVQHKFSQIDFDYKGYSQLRMNEYYKYKEKNLAL